MTNCDFNSQESTKLKFPVEPLFSNQGSEILNNSSSHNFPVNSHDAIAILVYPPKNKRFKFDPTMNTLVVEPARTEYSNETGEELFSVGMPSEVPEINIDNAENLNGTYKNQENMSEIQESLSDVRQDKFHVDKQCSVDIRKVFSDSKLGADCFLKGCKWSPDGYCLLTSSDDYCLRIFEPPSHLLTEKKSESSEVYPVDVQPVLTMKEGGTVYDFCWYPLMNSSNPATCV